MDGYRVIASRTITFEQQLPAQVQLLSTLSRSLDVIETVALISTTRKELLSEELSRVEKEKGRIVRVSRGEWQLIAPGASYTPASIPGLLESVGWKRDGRVLQGFYRVGPKKTFYGEVETLYTGRWAFRIRGDLPSIACFNPITGRRGWFKVNFTLEPKDELSGIRDIENRLCQHFGVRN